MQQRGNRWTHLALCVMDAVYSIGANHDTHTRPTVCRYAALAALTNPLKRVHEVAAGSWARDEVPLTALLADLDQRGPEGFADWVGNHQRTSTRRGILKAEAVQHYARILVDHGVRCLADVTALLNDRTRFLTVQNELATVPGLGAHGVRQAYLWMVAGDDENVKPDRMVRWWLGRVLDQPVDPQEAQQLFVAAAAGLQVTQGQL